MSDLESHFAAAQAASRTLATRPDNAALLKLYALYKQAGSGDVDGKRPGITDPVGRAKYDAWAALKGSSREASMQQYIALVDKLRGG